MNEELISNDKPLNLLLVEGNDDFHVCRNLLHCYQIEVPEHIEVVDKKGIDNLLQSLEVDLLGSGTRRIGILIDADKNIESRWQTLKDILEQSGYSTVPNFPYPNGTIIEEEDKPKVGLWIMPNNQVPGMLEDFCSFLIPASDVLWKTAQDVLEQVIQQDQRFPDQHKIKALIHTWLAWQRSPGKPIGQAITQKFLDHQAPHAKQLITWVHELYELK